MARERVSVIHPAPDGERAGLLDYGQLALDELEAERVDLDTVRRDFRRNGRCVDRDGQPYAGPVNVWSGTRELDA